MQVVKITYADFFNATVVTPAMVEELALGLGMTQAQVAKLKLATLAKASGGRGGKSNGAGDCPDAKLRTVVLNKLSNTNDIVSSFTHGNSFEYEFKHLPDEQPAADPAPKAKAPAKRNGKLSGAYKVVRKDGLRCTQESDPEKFALWQFVWNCNTFEEYFAKAPAKAVTRTGRIITASSEMLWAIKCGWIVPVAA